MLHEKKRNKKFTAVIGYLGQSYNIVYSLFCVFFLSHQFINALLQKWEFTHKCEDFFILSAPTPADLH